LPEVCPPLARYAAYWAPPADSALWRLGCQWLGRDPETAADLPIPESRRAITADPRRYGFHATLKPPFALADGASEPALVAAMARLAESFTPFVVPGWRLTNLDGFLALCPPDRPQPLHALADACVAGLDHFRRPASTAEIARRRPERFSPRERHLLHRWGYPHVFETFRAHLTLSARLDAETRARVTAELGRFLVPLPAGPVLVDQIALFIEPEPGAPFRLARRFPFGRNLSAPAAVAKRDG
jgi:putative phosphonate metabolism protein